MCIRDRFYGAAFDEFNREWQGIALEEQTEPTSHKEEQEIPPDYTKMSIQERVKMCIRDRYKLMDVIRLIKDIINKIAGKYLLPQYLSLIHILISTEA